MRHPAVLMLLWGAVACGTGRDGAPPIRLEWISTISGPGEDEGFQSFATVSPRFRGGQRLVFMPDLQNEVPWVLDAEGRATRPLGTVGDGPGQFRRISAILLGQGDSVLIFDQFKVHIFTPDLEYVRSIASPEHSTWSPSVLAGGRIAIPSRSRRPAAVSVISQGDGAVLWTIPADSFGLREFPDIRLTAADPDGSLWVMPVFRRLVLQHFSAEGTLLATIQPTASWFEPWTEYQRPSRDRPTSPSLKGFWIDSLHRAWVIAHVADLKWADAEGEVRKGEGGFEYFIPKDANAVRDGLIGGFDLASGASLGSLRLDSMIVGSFEAGGGRTPHGHRRWLESIDPVPSHREVLSAACRMADEAELSLHRKALPLLHFCMRCYLSFGSPASISARFDSNQGGSTSISPRWAGSSSRPKPGPSVASSKRAPPGSLK